MDEQKVKQAFLIISHHLSKIDEEIEKIQNEKSELKDNMNILQTCFESLFRQHPN